MQRRRFLATLAGAATCSVCARLARAAEGAHWSYDTGSPEGPENWGRLPGAEVCAAGTQQSPVEVSEGSIPASLPGLYIDWSLRGGSIVNNGHTIQVNVPKGNRLIVGDAGYDLLQYHFHAPGEHAVEGERSAMEAHFVHAKEGGYGVVGVLLDAGPDDPTSLLTDITQNMPAAPEAPAVPREDLDAQRLLPTVLDYWRYEGSLTTPDCGETVDWIVLRTRVAVPASAIAAFKALYPDNARPLQPLNRRFVLRSV
jgi:carbonic anhydrase